MTTTLHEQARQSGLFLPEKTAQWNNSDWPPLEGGWREYHATVVLDLPDQNDNTNNNNKRQTVVVMGGRQRGHDDEVSSVLLLDLAESNMQWREGPPMNKKRSGHTAVVCNGGVYVMGGASSVTNTGSSLDCMERIDVNDLLQSSLTTSDSKESHWTTLNCRFSTQRRGCCAVAVQNRYIVVVGGSNRRRMSLVEVIDTRNHTVTAAPSMNVPREWCASAVLGHRIFVLGGRSHGNLDSVEYLDFREVYDSAETKEETASTDIAFSSTWTIHSNLKLSVPRGSHTAVPVGSCLVVTGGRSTKTVEILDTRGNRTWKLPKFGKDLRGCSIVAVANQIALIGGRWHRTGCATLPLTDKNSWCFRRVYELPPNGWYHCSKGMSQHGHLGFKGQAFLPPGAKAKGFPVPT